MILHPGGARDSMISSKELRRFITSPASESKTGETTSTPTYRHSPECVKSRFCELRLYVLGSSLFGGAVRPRGHRRVDARVLLVWLRTSPALDQTVGEGDKTMRKEQTASEMVVEVLARQAEGLATRTGRPLRESYEDVLQTEAGRQLAELVERPHLHEKATYWQANLLFERVDEQAGHPVSPKNRRS